jgi:predicted ATPase
VNPDVIQLAWRHAHQEGRFGAAALSDGTLRFMCLATLLLQPEPPATVVIDEPELGLHPLAIHQFMALVRSVASSTQVVLATQSVTLLDEAKADEVIVCELSDGASTFRRLDARAGAGGGLHRGEPGQRLPAALPGGTRVVARPQDRRDPS